MNVSKTNTPGLLQLQDFSLTVGKGGREILKSVNMDVKAGEIVGIVGESGSGKTQVARAILDLTPSPLVASGGKILFEGKDLGKLQEPEMRQLRGSRIGMVFQEPMTSLNPSMKIGDQLREGARLHRPELNPASRDAFIMEMLVRVGITDARAALEAWPHEFSGGMRQRIMLAAVMMLEPSLLMADEPTTALDAVVQRDVLELMVSLTRERNTAVLLISHDLPMVARYTERVIVMRHGEVVEAGPTADILKSPRQPYTQRLLASMPSRGPARPAVQGDALMEVRDLSVEYKGKRRFFTRPTPKRVLHGVDLVVRPGEVVALVGGSGSGKTTLGRAIAGLVKPAGGEIRYKGQPVQISGGQSRDYRLNCQMVFQDPYSSLNPRMTIGELVGEGLRHIPELSSTEKRMRVTEMLDEVGLGEDYASRYPHEMSGGQRQRVAIARALIRRPNFVIADEAVSALDVTVRAQVLELFAKLQRKHGFSCLFISHDLGVVEQVADRVVVMQNGSIIEQGRRDDIFDAPAHDYTKKLLSAIPLLEKLDTGGVALKWRLEAQA